jgi:hypothetical protein
MLLSIYVDFKIFYNISVIECSINLQISILFQDILKSFALSYYSIYPFHHKGIRDALFNVGYIVRSFMFHHML